MMYIFQAMRIAYAQKSSRVTAGIAFLIAIALNYYSLISVVPGNSLALFLKTSLWWQIMLPLLLAMLIALLLGMQAYMLHHRFTNATMAKAGTGLFSSFAGVAGSVFGSAGCFSCLTALLGFLGTGTLLFLLKYRYAIIGVSLLLLLFSICLTAKGIACKRCNIDIKRK